jgi:hypothetical protein
MKEEGGRKKKKRETQLRNIDFPLSSSPFFLHSSF